MSNFYTIPDSVLNEGYEWFKQNYDAFVAGNLDELTFKTIRVSFGIYEQRTPNTYMVRIKTNGGVISPQQLIILSDLAKEFADVKIHVTTRGGVQLHYAKLENLDTIVERLHAVGLTGRGSGGNTVRNIVGDPLSGIAKDDVFDILSHANFLTTKMLDMKDSFNLPRKFKIAFSTSQADRAHATITDVGYIAKIKDGQRGFSVWIAGGMGAMSRLGFKLYDFLPESEIFLVAQAIKQVFDRTGNRKNKHAARLRFVAQNLGNEELARLIKDEIKELRKSKGWEFKLKDNEIKLPKITKNILPSFNKSQALWFKRFVREQKQKGYYYVRIPLQLGDINEEGARKLAQKLIELNVHETSICCVANQNIYLRHLKASDLLKLYPIIISLSEQSKKPVIIGDMVACTGAATCQLGIVRPRGATLAIENYLKKKKLDLDALQGFRIHMSGCPNSCGNHATANLGFFGKVLRQNERSYPAYNVLVGAIIEEGKTRFARKIAEIAAFYAPQFVYEVLKIFIDKKPKFKSFEAWVDDEGEAIVAEIAKKYKKVPDFSVDKNPYFDYSSDEIFSLKGRGSGECSAGMYDLIEADKKALQEAIKLAKEGELDYKLIRLLACRMLLVARGEEARDENGVIKAFKTLFVDSGLIDKKYLPLLEGDPDESAINLGEDVIALYATMDNSLKFAKEKDAAINESVQKNLKTQNLDKKEPSADLIKIKSAKNELKIDKFKDLRGVKCPMNFVKTKLELAGLSSGNILEITLDEGEPIQNVPGSVKAEGHEILSMEKTGDFWRVLIKKK